MAKTLLCSSAVALLLLLTLVGAQDGGAQGEGPEAKPDDMDHPEYFTLDGAGEQMDVDEHARDFGLQSGDQHHTHDHDHYSHGEAIPGHKCIHDDAAMGLSTVNVTESEATTEGRGMEEQAVTWSPIRIKFDTSSLEDSSYYCTRVGQQRSNLFDKVLTCKERDLMTSAKALLLKNTILPKAVAKLESFFQVVRRSGRNAIPSSNSCAQRLKIPSSFTSSTRAPQDDFVILVSAGPVASSGTGAWAIRCHVDSNNKRPLYGQYNQNAKFLDLAKYGEKFLVNIAVHEILHAMGFSGGWFNWVMSSKVQTRTLRGRSTKMLIGSNVRREVRNYFGCSTAYGAELEDGGGSGSTGSHWDSRTQMNDVMCATTGNHRYMSRITMAAMQDSGAYLGVWTNAEPMTWGKQAGCGFLNQKCNVASAGAGKYWRFDGSGSNQRKCGWNARARAPAPTSTYSTNLPTYFQYFSNPKEGGLSDFPDYCPYVLPNSYSTTYCNNPSASVHGPGEQAGAGSRCFEGSSVMPSCIKKRCTSTGSLQLNFKGSTSWQNCPAGSNIQLPGSSDTITCPNNNELCPVNCIVNYAFASTTSLSSSLINYILRRFNTYRMSTWNYATWVPLVKWNPGLANLAQRYANTKPKYLQSSSQRTNRYSFMKVGQSLAYSTRSSMRYFSYFLSFYTREKNAFNLQTQSCSRSSCRNWAQWIATKSQYVGCGYKYYSGKRWWACDFGEELTNGLKPYTLGEAVTDQCQYV